VDASPLFKFIEDNSFAGLFKTGFFTTPIDANFPNEIDTQNQWPILSNAVPAAISSPDYS